MHFYFALKGTLRLKGKWDNSGATEHSLTCQGNSIGSTKKTKLERTIIKTEKYGKC